MASRTATALTLAALLAQMASAIASEDLELLPKWKVNDVWKYEMRKSRQRIKAGKTILDVSTRAGVKVEILQADEKGYILGWTQGETTFDNPEHAKNPLVKAMVDLAKDYRIELIVDKEGSLEGVKNWKEVQKKSFEILDLLTVEMTKSGVPKATVDSLRKMVEPLASSEESIVTFFVREPAVLLIPLGHVYSPGKSIPYLDEMPNPFGGESFPTKSEIKLERIDAKTGHAVIRQKQTLDPAHVTRILEKTMKDLGKKLGKPFPPDQELPEFSVLDETEFVVESKTGRLVSGSHVRVTKTAGLVQRETIVLKPLAK
jgi:hypothetical protein